MSQPIVLNDLASRLVTTWSPSVWKIRLALDYKKLPYKILWLEFLDVEAACKSLGVAPTGMRADGSPRYTVPAIHDPNTVKSISDSAKIVRYFDEQYPDTPRLIPSGTSALHAAFDAAFMSVAPAPLRCLLISATLHTVNPPSEEIVRKTFEMQLGKPVWHYDAQNEAREECWRALEDGLAKVKAWMSLGSSGHPYFMGDQVCYADITVAAFLLWAKTLLGDKSEDWARLERATDGRWAGLINAV